MGSRRLARALLHGAGMRSIWTGNLTFGLLAIPVKLFSAVESKQEVSFHLLHKTDLAPVRYERVCTADGKRLEWDEIVKGYEYEKGQYAVVEKEEIAEVGEETSSEVPVLEFVSRGDIDPMSFDKPYFLAPDRGGERAYSVLREALAQEDKVAIVRITLRRRPHLAAVHPEREALALTMLRTADDLRGIDELDLSTRTPSDEEVKMARALVDQMTTEWVPDQFEDEYRERLKSLIEKKVPKRRAVHIEKPKKAGAASDLMAMLAKSLESTPKKAAAHAKKSAAKSHGHVRAAAKKKGGARGKKT
jgi:DNA end-binding protein Ku